MRVHGTPAKFEHYNPPKVRRTPSACGRVFGTIADPLVLRQPQLSVQVVVGKEETSVRDLKAFNLRYRGHAAASDSGDLVVQIPDEIRNTLETAHTEMDKTDWDLDVSVSFALERPHSAVVFSSGIQTDGSSIKDLAASAVEVLAAPEQDNSLASRSRAPHVVTSARPGSGGGMFYGGCGPRTWFPCVDTLSARYTYKLSVSAWCSGYDCTCSRLSLLRSEQRTHHTFHQIALWWPVVILCL